MYSSGAYSEAPYSGEAESGVSGTIAATESTDTAVLTATVTTGGAIAATSPTYNSNTKEYYMRKLVIIVIFVLSGCSILPTKNMVELPDGAVILTLEEATLIDNNLRNIAIEMLRLRRAIVPMGQCHSADYKDIVI